MKSAKQTIRHLTHFTLVELLIVTIIVVIIITLTVGTFMRIGPGIRLNASVHKILVQLSRARQLAIAQHRLVALLLPGAEGNIPDNRKFSAFRLAYVVESGSGYDFVDFVEDTEWGFCEDGITIMEVDGDFGIRDATGPLLTPSHENGTTVNKVDLQGLGGGNSVNNVRAIIFSPGQRLKAPSHQYITLGQAIYISGHWLIENAGTLRNGAGVVTNISCVNQTTIEVNRYTGGTRVYHPEHYP